MLTRMFELARTSPVFVALFGAHFPFYAALAWLVLAVRLVLWKKMSPCERALAGIWFGCLALEAAQVFYSKRVTSADETWGLLRYFGTFAPLLWLWLAKLLADVWKTHWAAKAVIVAALSWFAVQVSYGHVAQIYQQLTRQDVASAARRIARTIQRDYAGPRQQEKAIRTPNEYFTTARPVVFSDFGYAAWLVGGQSEGAIPGSGLSPYPDDYLFFRTSTGYGGRRAIDPKVYELVTTIHSSVGCEWRLYRRKTTPHR